MWKWVATPSAPYLVHVDRANKIIEAKVEVRAHDKVPTLRRVVNKVTLARLQSLVTPPAACPHCGALYEER